MNFQTFQRPLCDQLLLVAEDTSLRTRERTQELDAVAAQAEAALAEVDVMSEARSMDRLRLGAWLACMPSLRATATGEAQTKETAAAVLSSLQNYSEQLLTISSSELARTNRISDNLTGYMGEVGVLGLLWWGLANDCLPAGGSAYPSLSDLDGAKLFLSGRRAGVSLKAGQDIMLRDKEGCTQPIQVKNSDYQKRYEPKEGRKTTGYHHSVALLYVTELANAEPGYAPLILLDGVVSSERKLLTSALHIAKEEFRRARKLIPRSAGHAQRTAVAR